MSKPDVLVENHGSVFLLRPVSSTAREWINENVVSEDWQWFAGALACEPRLAHDLAQHMVEAGIVVE